MPKTKIETEAVGPEKAAVAPVIEAERETPAKEAGPRPVARKPAHAAEAVAMPQVGTPERARNAETLQQSVGNARVGQLMTETASSSGSPVIQRQTKGRAASGAAAAGAAGAAGAKPPRITLPLPEQATRRPTGEAEFQVGTVKVVALPDRTRSKPIMVKGKKRDAVTDVSLRWDLPGAKTKAGKVISVDVAPAPTLTIRTTYGPKASPHMKSGYGKGTTPEDIKAKKTSLGYHEGSHGEYAIQYTRDHRLPVFTGCIRQKGREWGHG